MDVCFSHSSGAASRVFVLFGRCSAAASNWSSQNDGFSACQQPSSWVAYDNKCMPLLRAAIPTARIFIWWSLDTRILEFEAVKRLLSTREANWHPFWNTENSSSSLGCTKWIGKKIVWIQWNRRFCTQNIIYPLPSTLIRLPCRSECSLRISEKQILWHFYSDNRIWLVALMNWESDDGMTNHVIAVLVEWRRFDVYTNISARYIMQKSMVLMENTSMYQK